MRQYDETDDEPLVVIERRSASAGSFLWGLAFGAAAALLFAPRSGEETRREIRRRARRVQSAAEDAAAELADTMVDGYAHARQSMEEKVGTARRALDLKRAQASEAIRAGREAATQARQELEARLAETKAAYQAGADVARAGHPAPPAGESSASDEERGAAGQ